MCADQRKLKTFEIVITLWEKNVETHAKEKVSWALGSTFTSLTHYQEKPKCSGSS